MKVNLDRHDFTAMISGITPHTSVLKDGDFFEFEGDTIGSSHGGQFSWHLEDLLDLDESDLCKIYLECKNSWLEDEAKVESL